MQRGSFNMADDGHDGHDLSFSRPITGAGAGAGAGYGRGARGGTGRGGTGRGGTGRGGGRSGTATSQLQATQHAPTQLLPQLTQQLRLLGEAPPQTLVVLAEKNREVGVAAVNLLGLHRVELAAFSDSLSFTDTMALLAVLQPVHIAFADSQRDRPLAVKIRERWGGADEFEGEEAADGSDGGSGSGGGGAGRGGRSAFGHTVISLLARKAFDQHRGRALVRTISVVGSASASAAAPKLPAAAAAAAAASSSSSFSSATLSSSLSAAPVASSSSSLPYSSTSSELGIDADERGDREGYLAYMALSALAALLERMQGLTFASGSVYVLWRPTSGRMAIDFETVRNLELVVGARSGSARDSLLGALALTKTSAGLALLRRQLLAPPNESAVIEARLDVAEELERAESVMRPIVNVLPRLFDLGTLLNFFASERGGARSPRAARMTIAFVIGLKHTLALLPQLVAALDMAAHPMLRELRGTLAHEELGRLRARIDEVITEDTTWSRNPLQRSREECFAVREGLDGNLDVMRKVHEDGTRNIHQLAEELRVEWNLAGLKLHHTNTRGHHLQCPVASLSGGAGGAGGGLQLPAAAVQVAQSKNVVAFSTDLLLSLNERVKESLQQVYQLTDNIVQALVLEVRGRSLAVLHRVADAVATLDMLQCFASLRLQARDPDALCRPVLRAGASGVLRIEQGRHPIIEHLAPRSFRFIANDVSLGPDVTLRVLTGPNCSGKSTYLRMAALLVIMAHVGVHLPAQAAQVRLTDRLCTRLGTGDDEEASTFLKEMKETAFLLAHATERSLVLIDELGRGTSNEDGVGIAWSVCEHLLRRRAHTLVVTHYHELAELAKLYANCGNISMDVEAALTGSGAADSCEGDGKEGGAYGAGGIAGLRFKFKLNGEAASSLRLDYGIALAEMAGLPTPLIADAKRLRDHLKGSLQRTAGPGRAESASVLLLPAPAAAGVSSSGASAPTASAVSGLLTECAADGFVSAVDAVSASRLRLARRLVAHLLPTVAALDTALETQTDARSRAHDSAREDDVDARLADADADAAEAWQRLERLLAETREQAGSDLLEAGFDGSGRALALDLGEQVKGQLQRQERAKERGAAASAAATSGEGGRACAGAEAGAAGPRKGARVSSEPVAAPSLGAAPSAAFSAPPLAACADGGAALMSVDAAAAAGSGEEADVSPTQHGPGPDESQALAQEPTPALAQAQAQAQDRAVDEVVDAGAPASLPATPPAAPAALPQQHWQVLEDTRVLRPQPQGHEPRQSDDLAAVLGGLFR